MKQYKIVKHWSAPDSFIYRLYKRQYLFWWSWETSASSIEWLEALIDAEKTAKEKQLDIIAATPDAEFVKFI